MPADFDDEDCDVSMPLDSLMESSMALVSLTQEGDRGLLTVRLDWQGEALAVQTLL